jgi:hypothetical protein
MECKIHYGNSNITLLFTTDEEIDKMRKAIENCIKYPNEYPLINYSDKSDDIIFTADFLKQSLIFFSKT